MGESQFEEVCSSTVILASGACGGGEGSQRHNMTPLQVDPLDLLGSSKNVVFIVSVVILGLDGAPALCFSDFWGIASHETPTFETTF